MSARRNLRTVKDDEKAPVPDAEPMSVTRAAADGSQLDLLLALRARVATAVEDVLTPPRDLAALSRRLQDISKEIEAIRLREKQEAETARTEGQVDESFDPQAV